MKGYHSQETVESLQDSARDLRDLAQREFASGDHGLGITSAKLSLHLRQITETLESFAGPGGFAEWLRSSVHRTPRRRRLPKPKVGSKEL